MEVLALDAAAAVLGSLLVYQVATRHFTNAYNNCYYAAQVFWINATSVSDTRKKNELVRKYGLTRAEAQQIVSSSMTLREWITTRIEAKGHRLERRGRNKYIVVDAQTYKSYAIYDPDGACWRNTEYRTSKMTLVQIKRNLLS